MSPRRYRLGQRQAAIDQNRERILSAARELLAANEGPPGFTIDAVARQAGVARMTVYYQYQSKAGLLEALCDFLACRGQIDRLASAFSQSKPLEALAELISVFTGFWDSDRVVIRRLRSLATLDPEIEQVIAARDERRRHGLRAIVGRLAETYGRPTPEAIDEAIDVLHSLTSFETYDALAGATRGPKEVAELVQRLARASLGLQGSRPRRKKAHPAPTRSL
jgi:AcrR family transcriptional regulator